jgi:hypothetical protein
MEFPPYVRPFLYRVLLPRRVPCSFVVSVGVLVGCGVLVCLRPLETRLVELVVALNSSFSVTRCLALDELVG